MARGDSHVQKRTYEGEADGAPIVDWLNQNARGARRIADLISDLQSLCGSIRPFRVMIPSREILQRFKREHPKLYSRISIPEALERGLLPKPETWTGTLYNGLAHDPQAESRADAALRRFSFKPYITRYPLEPRPTFKIAMIPSKLLNRRGHPSIDDLDEMGREKESWVVIHIIRLVEAGLIDRLRRCTCGKWFYSRFRHQRFCSTRCQQGFYHSSEEWKEKRRRKAREYYRLHKYANVK